MGRTDHAADLQPLCAEPFQHTPTNALHGTEDVWPSRSEEAHGQLLVAGRHVVPAPAAVLPGYGLVLVLFGLMST